VVNPDEKIVECHVDHDSRQADSQGNPRSVDRGKSGGYHFNSGIRNQTYGIATQCQGCGGGTVGSEATVLVDRSDHWLREDEEADGGR